MITPTYKRLTQKVDLVRLCQTLMLVSNVTWIVIEDASTYSKVVTNVLNNCKVKSVHLHEKTTTFVSRRKGGGGHRGVEQRNRGLKWIRDNHGLKDSKMGVVYFGDDDNGYDIRLFHEMRFTSIVSVWPVGFVGMLRYEGPNCQDGRVVSFHTSFRPDRTFPLDMGAFAVNLQILMNKPEVYINHKSAAGMLETTFLSDLEVKPSQLEARANDCKNIYVWHIKTEKPKMPYERQNPGDKTIEV
ncbi:PREDICTED: galactosylgalactosylxylosylprotein 3-beta-glucuronosyltransferase 3-like [Amphimedon queenslandica]|uniref:Galactosylgalactosylxylosylprotein 3-beta-glucuronosyltransferase n=1 Tax=Amphimedon queenslandica TaxID=400682 RepID=A0A1X7UUB1_AMPQE|nr:PREDICTED: galactosylgalactosylxylosylprotein 3-beta-glucuronosyltransferase 3-like [Amphimedon queenslandica]|eukprot:XP_003386699.1 PREDICTED: galactosylgalactosylxylosylprotein 3-beta-glucuronosyltransferase 3-like [Amphimedon queenslandica]